MATGWGLERIIRFERYPFWIWNSISIPTLVLGFCFEITVTSYSQPPFVSIRGLLIQTGCDRRDRPGLERIEGFWRENVGFVTRDQMVATENKNGWKRKIWWKNKRPKLPKSLCNGDFRFVGILAFGRVLRWDLLVVKAHGVYLRRAYFQEHRPKRGGVVPFCSFQL